MAAVKRRCDHLDGLGPGAVAATVEIAADLRAQAAYRRLQFHNGIGERLIGENLAQYARKRRANRVDIDRHHAGGATHAGRTELDLWIDADGDVQVARHRIKEGAVEVAVRPAPYLLFVSVFDLHPVREILSATRYRVAQPLHALAHPLFIKIDARDGIFVGCLPVAAAKVRAGPPRDSAEFLVIATEVLSDALRDLGRSRARRCGRS